MAFLELQAQATLHGITADGARLELPRAPVFFGRGQPRTADELLVQLAYNFVSRRHFVIEPTRDGWQLRDLGSSGGTWVNRQKVGRIVLKSGDVIDLAQRIAIFRDDNGGER